MKFRLPPECLGLTLGGKNVTIAADHTIDVDAMEAAALAAHAIVRADAPEPPRPKPKSGKPS